MEIGKNAECILRHESSVSDVNSGCVAIQLIQLAAAEELGEKSSNTVFELVVSGDVDERVEAATGKDSDDGEVVEPASEIDLETEVGEEEIQLVPRPTEDEAARDRQKSLEYILLGFLVNFSSFSYSTWRWCCSSSSSSSSCS